MSAVARKQGIFYGWWVIAACFVMSLYTSGVLGYGFTAVINPIMKEFGWSSAEVSVAASMRGVEAGLFAPAVGWLIDRFGSRTVLLFGTIITGLGMIILSQINSLVAFYLAFGLISIGTSALGNVTFIAAVANWFHRRLGFAMGLMVSGFGFSGLLVVPATMTIDAFGWRLGMIYMGIGVLVICIPLCFLVRDTPEKYGLLPDGDTVVAETSAQAHGAHARGKGDGISMKAALKSRAFWLIALALAFQHLIAGGVINHVMPYLSSIGYSRDVGSYVAAAIPLTSIIGRFGFGWLSDRMKNKHLMIIGFLLISLGMAFFAFIPSGFFMIVLFLLLFSIGFGGTNSMRAIIPRTYFGLKGYGTYIGLITGVGTIGSMIGPYLAGYTFDTLGNYQPIWLAYAGVGVVSLILTTIIPGVVRSETAGVKPATGPELIESKKE